MPKIKGVISFSKAHELEFSWAQAISNDKHSARCKLCHKTFSIRSMGRTAFLSHADGKKHKDAVKAQLSTPSAISLQNPRVNTNKSEFILHTDEVLEVDKTIVSNATTSASILNDTQIVSMSTSPSSPLINKYLLSDSVTKAEILWCLQAATRIHSNRTTADCVSLFPLMFPDSDIARKMRLHKDKVGYVTAYGLAPYFQKLLLKQLELCDFVSVGFDEALNEISTKKQMDLAIRYWDVETNMVSTRYFSSVFLRTATANDLRVAIREALGEKLEYKLLHLSMDGPNVNFKMLKDIQTALKEEYKHSLVDLGSCGLHVVHGAFKTGAKSVNWELKKFLMAIHYLFKDSPARRSHFIKTTGSDVFAVSFCFTRWIENAKAGLRAIAMLPHLKTWVEQVHSEGSKNPLNNKHKQFETVSVALQDRLLGPKLAFFVSTAEMVEPFLTTFQSNQPMAPLLFRELQSLTIGLLECVVVNSVLEGRTKVADIDLSKESNLKPATKFELTFAVKAAIKEASKFGKFTDSEILKFRTECRKFFICMIKKIQERSPLTFKMTRAVSCLDPYVVLETESLAKERISLTLDILCNQKYRISCDKADRIKRSFSILISSPSTKTILGKFDGKNPRLDTLWSEVIQVAPSSVLAKADLLDFIKMILILFHSNAALERSFSLNNNCIVINQKEKSLIGNRVVQDAVMHAGGVDKVVVTKSMIQATRNAYGYYKDAKETRTEEEKKSAERIAEKRKTSLEIKELTRKREKIMKDAKDEVSVIDLKIHELNQS